MQTALRQLVAPSVAQGGVIREIWLRGSGSSLEQRLAQYAASSLQRQLRCPQITLKPTAPLPELTIALPHWQNGRANIAGFDRLFEKVASEGDFRLVLWTRDWLEGAQPALELLNRYQRLLPLPQGYRPLPGLGELLRARRELTTSRQGHETWRWLLRSCPRPARPLELAALLHDVLLPAREGDARATLGSLSRLGLRRAELVEATELAQQSELGSGATPELTLLRDARDLGFFSAQSWDFAREQGTTVTHARLRRLLGRMTPRAVCLALGTRQPLDVSRMIEDVLDESESTPDSGIRRA